MSGSNEHDSYFKAVFSKTENAAGVLRSALRPELVAQLDFATAELVPGSFVDETLSARHTGLLFKVSFAGRPALLYVLAEHQSSVDSLLPVRLLIYMARIWERWLEAHPNAVRVPPILPFVVSQGPPVWSAPTSLHEVIDADPARFALLSEHVPSFRFVLDDLAAQRPEHLKARHALPEEGRVALLLLRDLRRVRRDPVGLAALLRGLRELIAGVVGPSWIYYVVRVTDANEEELQTLLARVSTPERELIMSTAERFLQAGILKGQQNMLLKLIGARFHADLTPEVERRVRAADASTLDRWIDAILTAKSLDELLST